MTMKQWIKRFFDETDKPDIKLIADKIDESPITDFNIQLQNLKSNIVPSTSIDKREFEDINWENTVDSKTESYFLRQIAKTLDTIASTPIGQNILSHIDKYTRFGIAPMHNTTGGYFNRNLPTVFVKSSLDIFKKPPLLLKILVHECSHAKNREMSEQLFAFTLPPRLLFMHQMMNELSAYLNEQIVTAQLTDKNITPQSISENQVFEVLDKLQDKNYIKDFSNRLTKWYGNKILESENKSFSEQQLAPFAYYFKICPALKNPHIILKLNQLYHNHVVKPRRLQQKRLEKNSNVR